MKIRCAILGAAGVLFLSTACGSSGSSGAASSGGDGTSTFGPACGAAMSMSCGSSSSECIAAGSNVISCKLGSTAPFCVCEDDGCVANCGGTSLAAPSDAGARTGDCTPQCGANEYGISVTVAAALPAGCTNLGTGIVGEYATGVPYFGCCPCGG